MVIFSAIALMIGLWYLINRTRTGRAMRAVSEDRDTAALMGINVDADDRAHVRHRRRCWPARPGVLYALIFSQVFFAMGFIPGIKAFTAAVLGGIGNIGGAVLGGFSLGILEQVGPNLFLTGYGVPGANQLTRRHRLRGPRHRPHHPADRHPGEEGVVTRESLHGRGPHRRRSPAGR